MTQRQPRSSRSSRTEVGSSVLRRDLTLLAVHDQTAGVAALEDVLHLLLVVAPAVSHQRDPRPATGISNRSTRVPRAVPLRQNQDAADVVRLVRLQLAGQGMQQLAVSGVRLAPVLGAVAGSGGEIETDVDFVVIVVEWCGHLLHRAIVGHATGEVGATDRLEEEPSKRQQTEAPHRIRGEGKEADRERETEGEIRKRLPSSSSSSS